MFPGDDVLKAARQWRHDFHRHPELLFDLPHTARTVADLLRGFGCDRVVTEYGKSGVVAVVEGARGPGPSIAIRADMDALPIVEATGLSYASTQKGMMHACGHDGHMAVLLGTVGHLAANRSFPGRLIAVFQPAEEGGAGAKVMVDAGLIKDFGIDEVYALHNWPGLDVGRFSICDSAMLAASDRFDILVRGRGGHAARPHESIDPIVIGSHIVVALQAIVSREVDPVDPAVLSVTSMHAGEAYNVISPEMVLKGTIRTLSANNRELLEKRVGEIVPLVARAFGAEVEIDYRRGYPSTRNHAAQARKLGDAAARVAGERCVDRTFTPVMGAEDFSYMLEASPGAFIFMGNGPTQGLHHPGYDFNDDALPTGMRLWIELMSGVSS